MFYTIPVSTWHRLRLSTILLDQVHLRLLLEGDKDPCVDLAVGQP
ncbi:hypothetical protein HanRHA438_Chr05g0233571 [Helianthus annuus]|nr:hypothetical protein HanRHA438_Chr05g0233571 [Helianthus annuus]